MLKNKIIVKKIRNIFILLMAIIIMFGAYHNIRNSRAENVIQIELEVADKSEVLSAQTLTIDATETSDGKYIANLPISVNKNIVTKYYTSSGEEIVVDAENNVAMVQLTQDEVNNKKMQVQTDYDTKEVTVDGKTETLYKKELTNEPAATENNAESTEKTQDQNETINDENQNVVVTGYMPLDAKLEVKEIDAADLTAVKIPSETQTVQKGYEISIYQMVEKQNSEDNTAMTDKTTNDDTISDENSTIDTNTENTNTESTQEKVEYNLDTYGEDITIKTKYDQTNEVATVYSLDKNNQAIEVESTIEENKVAGQTSGTVEDNSNEAISFSTGKTDDTVKYLIATQAADTDNAVDDGNAADDSTTNDDGTSTVSDVSTQATKYYLKSTATETTRTSGFLGNTNITREKIESITFLDSTASANSTKWSVSTTAGGIYAWYTGSGPYQVYIGSSGSIYANANSSYLFSFIAASNTCTAESVINNINLLNVSETTDMSFMFYNTGWQKMTSLNLGNNFDTSNATNMSNMFAGCGYTAMESFSLGSKFDTSNVTNMSKMFRSAGRKKLKGFSLGSKFNTSNVTDMSNMFAYYGYEVMTKLDLGENFDTSNVVDMESMFESCGYTSMTNLDLGDSFKTDKVSNMKMMFKNCGSTAMTTLDLGIGFKRIPNISGDVNLHEEMLEGCGKNGSTIIYVEEAIYGDHKHLKLNASTTTRVDEYTRGTIRTRRYLKSASDLGETTATSGFLGNTKITREKIESITFLDNIADANSSTKWDVSAAGNNSIIAWYTGSGPYQVYIGSEDGIFANVTASYLFANIGSSSICKDKNVIYNIDLLNVTRSTAMECMFFNCGSAAMTQLNLGNNFNTRYVVDMGQMFQNCGRNAMTTFNLGDKFYTSKVNDMNNMFSGWGFAKMQTLDLGSNFDTSQVTNMNSMFQNCGYTAMTDLTLGENFNTSNVTDMSYMFQQCGYKQMTALNLGGKFDTNQVTDMKYMFMGFGHDKLEELDLGDLFDTSNVINMSYMFQNCGYELMTKLDLGGKFNTSQVLNMSYMFYTTGRNSLTSLNLGKLFNTSSVLDMSYMFFYCGYTSMTELNLGENFNTSSVQKMESMFQSCGHEVMTSLNLGAKGVTFNTSSVTTMKNMFNGTGYKLMTTLNLGDSFDTSNVSDMSGMFQETGYTKMTSLNLGKKFNTAFIVDMSNMFNGCGQTAMTSLDLGPAFIRIANTNTDMFTNCGKSGAIIYAPESIYKNRTTLKKYSLDPSDGTGTVSVSTGRTINPKYRPEWSVTGTTVDTTNKALKINIKGTTNTSNYTSDVETHLTADDISVWIDDTELTGVTITVSTANPTKAKSVTHTITITNFEEAKRQSGKSYIEWSGNITLKIGGREDTTETYSKQVLIDDYGNQNMSKIDTSGTWVDVNFKDSTKSSVNTSGKLFADVVNPAVIYEYSNTTIDHGTKTVTVVFYTTDKYFSSSSLTADQITVKFRNKGETNSTVATNAQKTLTKLTDSLTATVDGTQNAKVGEKYKLVITNLDQNDGDMYSGVMSLSFPAGQKNSDGTLKSGIIDKSGNLNLAKTITIGIDDPTIDNGHNSEVIVDVVSPVWKTDNIRVDKTNSTDPKVLVDLIATDKYLESAEKNSTLTTSKITLSVDGDTNANTSITKTLSNPTFSTNSSGLKEIKYTLTLSNWEQASKQSGKTFLEYSGTTKITIAAGTVKDDNENTSKETSFTLGHVDFIKPRIEQVGSVKIDKTNKTETITFNVIDKYLDTSDQITANDIIVYIDGENTSTSTLLKTIKRITGNDVSMSINGSSRVVSQQYELVLSDFEQEKGTKDYRDWSGTVSIDIAAGAVKDKKPDSATKITDDNTNDKVTIDGGFVDFLEPEFTYKYSSTNPGIDHTNKTVTVVFDVTDKYFASSELASDTYADKINVTIGGKAIVNDSTTKRKSLLKQDIKATINGTSKVVGQRYTLIVSNIDLGGGGDYSGIMKMSFAADIVKDTSENGNVAKTITIGVDDEHGEIIDVVSPVWIYQNVNVDVAQEKVTVELIATDRYLDNITNSTLTENDITLKIDGDETANTNITKTLTKDTVLSTNVSTGLKEIKYTLTLTGWQDALKNTGKEYSGTAEIIIKEGTITDAYSNKSSKQSFTLGHVDVIKPRVNQVGDATIDTSNKKEIITFKVEDKYLDTATKTKLTLSDISLYVDGELVPSGQITRTLSEPTNTTESGSSQIISQNYTLELSNFEQTTRNTKDYKNWSGTVTIKIANGAVMDKEITVNEVTSGGNLNDETTIQGKFVDFINPNIKYVHQDTDINKSGKSYTMTFSITDKYYRTGKLTLDNLVIKMQNGQKDSSGNEIIYNLKNEQGVQISLQESAITATNVPITTDVSKGTIQTQSSLVIGYTYTLTISNLEQLEIKTGLKTADYSGIVTVAVAGNKILDKGPTGTNTSSNGNIATTITSGVNIPGGTTSSDAKVVDVVAPIWQKVSSTANVSAANAEDQSATVIFKGTDTYYASNSLNANNIEVWVDGVKVTLGFTKTLSAATELKEQRKEFGKTTTVEKQYGVQYTLTIRGFSEEMKQVKIRIPENTLTDESGNTNASSEIMVYNSLVSSQADSLLTDDSTDSEANKDAGFLGNTSIKRQNIEQVIFEKSIPSSVAYNTTTGKYGNSTAWDVSAMKDKSIIAWYDTNTTTGALKVHIASDYEIFANRLSGYLFTFIGYSSICKETEGIVNLNYLNVSGVRQMNHMFDQYGANAVTKLDLGAFDTSGVHSMRAMFRKCGYNEMTELNLGTKFSTSNATDMAYMFADCGYGKMTSLNLVDGFNTSNVTDMSYMFRNCGYTAMTTLDLGAEGVIFDTQNVTAMPHMFDACGYMSMSSFNLGTSFNTSKVENMRAMFQNCGYTAMTNLDLSKCTFDTSKAVNTSFMFQRCGYISLTSLNLGENFDTSNVENMRGMFKYCGYTKMEELSLGTKFNTEKVTDMYKMFQECGAKSMTSLDLGPKFTKIPSSTVQENNGSDRNAYDIMLANCGKHGAQIYVPESIYGDKTNLKLSSTAATKVKYQEGTSKDETVNGQNVTTFTETGTRGTIIPKYKPEWTVTGTTADTTNKALKIDIKGSVNTDNYTSNVETHLTASNISVWIDDTELTGVTITVSTANPTKAKSITHTITITNFEEATKQSKKSYKEWSGNITLKIDGRGGEPSTYGKNVLVDDYGNQSMGQIDESETWIDISFKDSTTSSANTSGKLFADFVSPSIIYEYFNTEINHDNKTVTIVFDVTDKYYNSTKLSITEAVNKIEVTVDGTKATNAKKTLTKISNINAKIDGNTTETKIGEKYQLVIENLDQGLGEDYSGIMKLDFPEDWAIDKSLNGNVAKTITIGIDDPTNDPEHNSGVIVDVVSPAWSTNSISINKTSQEVTVQLIAKDKYGIDSKECTLTKDNITLKINGDDSANTAITKTLTGGTLSTDKKQITYTLKLSGWGTASTALQKQTGNSWEEYSGTTEITINAGVITDTNSNKSQQKTLSLGHVDVVKPRIEKVSSTGNATASTETIVFKVVDKYLDTSDAITDSEITVYVDGENASTLTRKLTKSSGITETINGNSQVVSQQYELVLSDFEKSITTIESHKNYVDWSGTVTMDVAANAVKDSGGNTNNKTTINANFVDFIKPKVIYKYIEGDIDYTNKKFRMTIDITDKYYTSGTTITTDNLTDWLTIKIDDTNITDVESVTKKIIATENITAGTTANPISKTIDGTVKTGLTNQVVGKRYTLEVSGLEQVLKAGDYLDYSGVVTVTVKEGVAKDNGPSGNGTNPNANDTTIITSGVTIPGDQEIVVDVVSPIWERAGATIIDPSSGIVSLGLRGTDKYLDKDNSSLKSSDLRIFVSDVEVTGNISITVTKDESVSLTYGIQYRVEITGIASDADQVKMIIKAGNLTDKSGNTSKETSFLLYSSLRKTNTETDANSPFLGNNKIERQKIEKIILKNNLDGANQTTWDVSAQKDESIIAWYETTTRGTYTVYIGSYSGINANSDSSYLFAHIGYASNCVATGNTGATDGTQKALIENIGFLNTNAIHDMNHMFYNFGHKTMKSLDLGSNFNTSNATNMSSAFEGCGYTAMESFDLGEKFDTQNVTNMSQMFYQTGRQKLKTLNLGEQFNTSSVTDMSSMFKLMEALTTLNLGTNFDTSNVTNMSGMFWGVGYSEMISFSLGDNFNTSSVENMNSMFYDMGGTALTTLNLGNKFYTTSTTDMAKMFYQTGKGAMTTLDLGPVFTKIANTNTDMFTNTGKSGTVINVPESIYKNRTSFKLSSDDTSTAAGAIAVSTGRTVNPKYRPEWSVTGTTIDKTKRSIKVDIKGAVNTDNYTSNVKTNLAADNISVWIDGNKISAQVSILTSNPTTAAASVTHTIEITGLEEDARQNGKIYKEWSGNITLKIDGRGEATSTYGKNVLTDEYGNKSMSEIDTSGTWVNISFSDSISSIKNEDGKLFADFVAPEFTYEYSDTSINYGTKTVTIKFSVADKYFKTSKLTTDTTASNITVTADGKEVKNDTKQRKSLTKKDITATIDGTSKKIGEEYTLELTNLDEGEGGDYSGIVKLTFAEGTVTDQSDNKSITKIITIGIDDPTNDPGHNSGVIVDVVSPVWKIGAKSVDNTNKLVTVELIATDKYLKSTSLTVSQITLTVDGDTTANTEITKTLSNATTITTNSSTGLKEIKYVLTLSKWVEAFEKTGTEYSGTISIKIGKDTITDDSGNKNVDTTFDNIGAVDFVKPRIEQAENATVDTVNNKETIKFNVIDKYLNTTKKITTSNILVYVDGELVDGQITRTLSGPTSSTTNGVTTQKYELSLSNFDQSVRNSKNYKNWSGTVTIKIAEGIVSDQSQTFGTGTSGENTNDEKTLTGGFVDFIKPDLRYVHQDTDINKDGKTYTMTFTVTDKYYTSGKLGIDDLTIKMQNGQKDSSGNEIIYNLKDEQGVGISLQDSPLTASNVPITTNVANGTISTVTSLTIGHTYTLTISNLEQLEIKTGRKTADYSGIITVAVAGNKILDKGPIGTNTNANGNVATTITSGVSISDGVSSGNATAVDVVDPIWTKVSSTASAIDPEDKTSSTATITIRGTDTYYASNTLASLAGTTFKSSANQDKIKVFVNGSLNTNVTVKLSAATALKEQRKEFGKTTTAEKQYGVEYTLTLTGFSQSADQIKIQLPKGTILDETGNSNKETEMIVYNTLKKTYTGTYSETNSESNAEKGFLGSSNSTKTKVNTIQRQNIDSITFKNGVSDAVADTTWDVSARGDNSILAWYTTNANGSLEVYIGSDDEIFANQDSTDLFAYIGYSSKCTSTATINGMDLLNVKSVKNMYRMFRNTGYNAMTKLDLGSAFDTSNVTNMSAMFEQTGYKAMTTFNIGNNFDTSLVTSMQYMFNGFGHDKLISLNLGSKFNTSNVTKMQYMFNNAGYTAMTSLKLETKLESGEKNIFDTSKVTDMSYMFANTGHTAMTSLDLGDNFNTKLVTNMSHMFDTTGHTTMTSLKIGAKFDTRNVTDMQYMFNATGYTKITSLDLGEKFDTNKVTNMTSMFNGCGHTAMKTLNLGPAFTKVASTNTNFMTNCGATGLVIYAPESIYSNKTAFYIK